MYERPKRIEPGPGQESVWDYPRPPALQPVELPLRVVLGGETIAETTRGYRVCETSHAPAYYFPPDDVRVELTGRGPSSMCEWKGIAEELDWGRVTGVGWRYVRTFPEYVGLRDWVSFYPRVVECWVGDERATPQPGGFYGGWVTSNLAGPIKGGPVSDSW